MGPLNDFQEVTATQIFLRAYLLIKTTLIG